MLFSSSLFGGSDSAAILHREVTQGGQDVFVVAPLVSESCHQHHIIAMREFHPDVSLLELLRQLGAAETEG